MTIGAGSAGRPDRRVCLCGRIYDSGPAIIAVVLEVCRLRHGWRIDVGRDRFSPETRRGIQHDGLAAIAVEVTVCHFCTC